MRLLFSQAGPSAAFDIEENAYVDSNDDRKMLGRYRKYCDELRLLLRSGEKIYTKAEALANFFPFPKDLGYIVPFPNIYKPRKNLFNLKLRMEARNIIEEEFRNADRVIVRTCGFWPNPVVIDMCRKYGKLYMIEAVEFPFAMRWYSNNPLSKLRAPYAEMRTRNEIARAPYVAYVTQSVLQQRYPTSGKSLGCSDVELPELDPQILETRINTYGGGGNRVIFGTAANIGSLKGQAYVVRALAELKRQGITNIEYHLAGVITTPKFQALVNSLNLQDQVKLFGPIPHGKIFDWYDTLDVYIHPSFTEGLCRSIVEAMSRALPVTCSDAGGNPELASGDMLFKAGNVGQICGAIKRMLDPEVRKSEAMRSFALAKSFQKSRLDPIRDKFYMDFINGI